MGVTVILFMAEPGRSGREGPQRRHPTPDEGGSPSREPSLKLYIRTLNRMVGILSAARLVDRRRDGKVVMYELTAEASALLQAVLDVRRVAT